MDRLMCMAGEVGKIVINECLKRNIFINTQKLEKLLVLMQIEHMSRVKTALFPQDILVWDCGVIIKEVDQGFIQYAIECKEEQIEYISLLDEQLKTVQHVLKAYGDMDALEINKLPAIQTLISKSLLIDGRRVIPSNIMLGFYL